MKSEDEVRQKYAQLLGRNLEKNFQKRLGRKPHNCVHNHVQSSLANINNKIEVQHTGLCMLNSDQPDAWEGRICETSADARFCPFFTAKETKQEVYDDFMSKVTDPEFIQHELRDLYILQWVLGEQEVPPKLSLIDRIKFWVKNYTEANRRVEDLDFQSSRQVEELSDKLFSEE